MPAELKDRANRTNPSIHARCPVRAGAAIIHAGGTSSRGCSVGIELVRVREHLEPDGFLPSATPLRTGSPITFHRPAGTTDTGPAALVAGRRTTSPGKSSSYRL